ncbi:hypothetical protein [Achromobacter sp. GD03932]|uniref:hypothetical protein n=1 Tax=Achromobacter sp. GD03932 TaxID=2975407 RepID=UPI00244B5288|nr:hypothetical protein [Achromobacter sp. GD03932]MDH1299718.1 hypothetical protein [Achromobacter sp. GD03932]
MALADYYLCDVCRCKCFYDAKLNYEWDEAGKMSLDNMGDMAAICKACTQTHEVIVRPKIHPKQHNDGGAA